MRAPTHMLQIENNLRVEY